MKKLYIFLIIGLLVHASLSSQEVFYYCKGNKRILTPVENKIFIKTDDEILSGNQVFNETDKIEKLSNNLYSLESSKTGIAEFKSKVNNKQNYQLLKYYKNASNKEVGVFNEIVVKAKKGISDSEIKRANSGFDLSLVKQTKLYSVYRVQSSDEAISTANALYETGLFEYAEPSFLVKNELFRYIPNDTYFGYQVPCHNIGQETNNVEYLPGTIDADIDAPEAWDITLGDEDIIIAVIDEGITSDHPDLPNSRQVRLPGSDFTTAGTEDDDPSPDPPPDGIFHGTACAGVIAATINNNEGIAGIAPLCKIMPIKLTPSGPGYMFAEMMIFAVDNGADIVSNSWGCAEGEYGEVIEDAYQYAEDNNVFVFHAAGNYADQVNGDPGFIAYPATLSQVIAVGASDRNDHQSNYSPSCSSSGSVFVCGPSNRGGYPTIPDERGEMWSLDIPGNDGRNPSAAEICDIPAGEYLPSDDDYTGRFGGTSHACPVVAGVAALTLSIDPDLTIDQMKDILSATADKVGGYWYSDYGHSCELGYGRVNAFEAVMAACPTSYTIDWDFTYDETLKYTASDYINVESDIPNGASIRVSASNEVKLLPGFNAHGGCYFRGKIEGCTKLSDGGSFKSNYQSTQSESYTDNFNDGNENKEWKSEENLNDNMNISIYPNPGKGEFTISGLDGNENQIVIYNMLGKQIYSGLTDEYSRRILIDKGPGIYLLKIINSGRVIKTEKLYVM